MGNARPGGFPGCGAGAYTTQGFRGVFNIRVVQPLLFVNTLVGTQGVYATDAIEEYLNRVVVSHFNDLMGEETDTIFNFPSRYESLAGKLAKALEEDFAHIGLLMNRLYINSITPPPEFQQAIDDRSRLGVFDDLNKLLKMKAAMAMETAGCFLDPDFDAGMALRRLSTGGRFDALSPLRMGSAGGKRFAGADMPELRLRLELSSKRCAKGGLLSHEDKRGRYLLLSVLPADEGPHRGDWPQFSRRPGQVGESAEGNHRKVGRKTALFLEPGFQNQSCPLFKIKQANDDLPAGRRIRRRLSQGSDSSGHRSCERSPGEHRHHVSKHRLC